MGFEIKELLLPLISGIGTFLILFVARIILFKILNKWASKTKTKLDDIVIEAFKKPSFFWCIAFGLYIAIAFSNIQPRYFLYISKLIQIIIILSITIAIAKLSSSILKHYIEESKISFPTTGLFYTIIKGTVYIIGFLIILNLLGVLITPIITALGVGGLAVALALKDTLENLFAGIHILIEKSIRVGDYVKLEGGQEGYVEDITWRTTRIRMLSNNIIIIPNNKLAQNIVTNYHLPDKNIVLSIPLSVSYSSDPEIIEEILLEEVEKASLELDGILKDVKPVVRFNPGFGESSLNFTLFVHIDQYDKQYLIQSELRKRIFKRFKEENIEIPFPHRVVYLKNE